MSADQAAEPARTYTKVERADKSIAYECNLCVAESPDLDAARAHRAVHVAGPELLDAAKLPLEWRIAGTPTGKYQTDCEVIRAAIAKAEPKG
jgi:hypothetical protein